MVGWLRGLPWWAWVVSAVLVLGIVAAGLAWSGDENGAATATASTTTSPPPPPTLSPTTSLPMLPEFSPTPPFPPPTTTNAVQAPTMTTRTGSVPGVVVATAHMGGSSGDVSVSWYAVPGANAYRVLRTDAAGGQARVMADFNVTTGLVASVASGVSHIRSDQHSYKPNFGPLIGVDRSPLFQYTDGVGRGERCYRVQARNSAGSGPLSAVVCEYAIGERPTSTPPTT